MTHSDDPMNVLRRFITEDHADRLLSSDSGVSGGSAGDDGLAPVVNLLAALQTPGTTDELSGADDLLAQMRTAMQSTRSTSTTIDIEAGLIDLHPVTALPRRNTMLAKIVTGKVAALAAVGIFSVGAAAAATGTLPAPVQRSVSTAVSHVGLDLPEPSDRSGETFKASTSDDNSSSSSSSTSTVTTLPSSASAVAGAAVNSNCSTRHDGSDDTGSYYGSSSSTSTTIAGVAAPACVEDKGVDSATHDAGDDKGVDPATHDAGDDKGGARVAGTSDDNSGSGSSGSGSSGRRGGSDDSVTGASTPSNTVTSVDDHGDDSRTSTSTTSPSSGGSSAGTATTIDDHGSHSGSDSSSTVSGSGSGSGGSNSGKG